MYLTERFQSMTENSERPVALVTGGGTGVGRACALQFAERGYDVVVNYSRSAAEAEQTVAEVTKCGTTAVAYQCDVSSDAAVRVMITDVEKRFGRQAEMGQWSTSARWRGKPAPVRRLLIAQVKVRSTR